MATELVKGFDFDTSPVKESKLRRIYRSTGSMYPGRSVCSKVRWRIFLRKMVRPEYYESLNGSDGIRVTVPYG